MNKSIIIISGDNESKKQFENECKKSAWVWRLKNHVGKSDEESKKEVIETIERFNDDDSSYKAVGVGDCVLIYNKFILLIDSTDDDFTNELEDDYGVFNINLVRDYIPITDKYDYYIVTHSTDFARTTSQMLEAFSK